MHNYYINVYLSHALCIVYVHIMHVIHTHTHTHAHRSCTNTYMINQLTCINQYNNTTINIKTWTVVTTPTLAKATYSLDTPHP